MSSSSKVPRWLLPLRDTHLKPPSTITIFSLLLSLRLSASLFSLISDCDETFNYWEALHLILFGSQTDSRGGRTRSFETWEYDPEYAIRSWAYIFVHASVGWVIKMMARGNKLAVFFGVRAILGLVSAIVETRLVSTVSRVINPRCGWILLALLAGNAGLWSASVALLPSSFTMYTTTLALSYSLEPSRSDTTASLSNRSLPHTQKNRLIKATGSFALGAILGWPFAIVLAIPFAFEELFLPSGHLVRQGHYLDFIFNRLQSFLKASIIAATIAIPIFLVDSYFYGKSVLIPFNIIRYNLLSSQRGAGPELYGVEPWWFYLANLGLNAGPVILLLALGSLPVLLVSRLFTAERFVSALGADKKDDDSRLGSTLISSSRLGLLTLRLAPWYLWLGLLSTQPHKEERFMFLAYTAMCFNAAVSLDLAVGALEKVVSWLAQSSNTSKSGSTQRKEGPLLRLPNVFAAGLIGLSSIFAAHRILGTLDHYHAPFAVLYPLSSSSASSILSRFSSSTPGDTNLNICYGKEWYRFPTSFFLPTSLSGAWIKSEFDGILPKHFWQEGDETYTVVLGQGAQSKWIAQLDSMLQLSLPEWSKELVETTRTRQVGFNDMNMEEWDRYIDVDRECHFLVDSTPLLPRDLPSSMEKGISYLPTPPENEPYFSLYRHQWEKISCRDFLDSEASKHSEVRGSVAKIRKTLSRILWAPKSWRREGGLRYREFCLLANKALMKEPTDDLENKG